MFNSDAFERFLHVFLIILLIFILGVQCGIKSCEHRYEMRCIYENH